jgi:non-homologous end joining protein Ku
VRHDLHQWPSNISLERLLGELAMAHRSVRRGHLSLALVSCPLVLYSAKHDRGSIHFNLINPKTGNRIRMITQDAETDEPLERLGEGLRVQEKHVCAARQ